MHNLLQVIRWSNQKCRCRPGPTGLWAGYAAERYSLNLNLQLKMMIMMPKKVTHFSIFITISDHLVLSTTNWWLNSGLYVIRTLDLCDTGAALFTNEPTGSRSLNWLQSWIFSGFLFATAKAASITTMILFRVNAILFRSHLIINGVKMRTPKRRILNLSFFFEDVCFNKTLLIKYLCFPQHFGIIWPIARYNVQTAASSQTVSCNLSI